MFDKILIANRGEIACRIIRTAKSMGIATVAIYSDADANSDHVVMADEAIRVGTAASAESYLKGDVIIKAALESGAKAIHPGFGFLSENADFVEKVKKAGLVFIGPDASAIASMGDKIRSRKIAEKAGVSVIPGTDDAVDNVDVAAKMATKIGYPVMIKASAGGGGKGMRVAKDEAALRVAMPQAQNEAKSAFGDGRVFVEKFITSPRHIEIQILGDTHGNIIYVGERECSLQRRHQKVFEEAPSPFISDKTRAEMGKQSVELARSVGYCSAGTVEFVVGSNGDFYFLEMNTRLQVEHPVTECVYGLDLVEWMIRIANGEKLTLSQKDIKPKGWAVEARVYAEDPSRNFLPSIGRLERYKEPTGKSIRVDSGVSEGGEISMHYDPMIAKIIAHGKSRIDAINCLADGLDRYVIDGLGNNRQFLRHVCSNPQFIKGDMTTGFIAEEYPDGYTPDAPVGADLLALRGLACVLVAGRMRRMMTIGGAGSGIGGGIGGDASGSAGGGASGSAGGSTGGSAIETDFILYDEVGEVEVCIDFNGAGVSVKFGKDNLTFEPAPDPAQRLYCGKVNGKPVAIQYRRRDESVHLMAGASALNVKVLPLRAASAQARMPKRDNSSQSAMILAPMPGLLTRLLVKSGDSVAAGDDVAVIEAMKMENLLKSDSKGVVEEVMVAEGDSLTVGQPIIRFVEK